MTITNADEHAYLYNLALRQSCWIGLNDIASEGNFEWQRGGNGYLNFGNGQPDNWNNAEDCVYVSNGGLWNDCPCSSSLVYICQTCEPGKYSGVGTPVCKPLLLAPLHRLLEFLAVVHAHQRIIKIKKTIEHC